jgi:hypothetical protein
LLQKIKKNRANILLKVKSFGKLFAIFVTDNYKKNKYGNYNNRRMYQLWGL